MPAVNLVTTEFTDAATAQCDALAFDAAIVWLPHPIQNRTTAELHLLAEACVEQVLAQITLA